MKNIYLQNASAGSGKTHTLAEEVTNSVVEKGCAPEELVVTTFTKKAAAELRERLRARLIKEGRTDEAHRVKDGHIGTVNSVSARIMKEYAIEAGASPALDVLPVEDEARIFNIAITDAIAKRAEELESVAERCGLNEEYAAFSEPKNWQNDVRDIVRQARSNRLTAADIRKHAEKSWNGVEKLFGEARDGRNDGPALAAAAIAYAEKMDEEGFEHANSRTEDARIKRLAWKAKRNRLIPWAEWVHFAKALPTELREAGAGLSSIASLVLSQKRLYEDVKTLTFGVLKCAADALEMYADYKQENAIMDFADQDAGVLDLLYKNPRVADMFKERIREVFVDEFQDTNPIQLAFFLELAKLADESLWVGDPKQAIYGFRGTDANLMTAATGVIPPKNVLPPLGESYRSKGELLALTNAVFTRVFHEMDAKSVHLDPPDDKKDEAKGGWIETWNIPGKTADHYRGIAGAVKELLDAPDNKYKPGEIAVLCRKNEACAIVAKNLENMGVRAAAEQGNLLYAPECQLAVAALKYLNDKNDSLSLTEIVSLSPWHHAHKNWLAEIMEKSKDPERYETRFDSWKEDPLIQRISENRVHLYRYDVMQTLETAIESAMLVETISIWTKPEQRLGNLDKLRSACAEYLEYCRVQRAAASLTGFLKHLAETKVTQAQGVGEDAVQVMTYHKAKGLQWKVVVIAGLEAKTNFDAFGVSVESETEFDASKPLAGRYIRYWPWPFGSVKKASGLDELVVVSPEYKRAEDEAKAEAKRLLYVGMTRAAEGMILVGKQKILKDGVKFEISWLNELVDKGGLPVISLPMAESDNLLAIGDATIPVSTRNFDVAMFGDEVNRRSVCYTAPIAGPAEHLPARITASGLEDKAIVKRTRANQAATFKTKLLVEPDSRFDPEDVGQAVHAYFAAVANQSTIDEKLEIAKRCVDNWDVAKNFQYDAVVAVGNELAEFLGERYPGAEVMREWPVTYINADGQLMEGYIDMLLETEDGYVIVDHKTGGTTNDKGVAKYAPQLNAYRTAVEAATSKPVLAMLVHMPVVGAVYSLEV